MAGDLRERVGVCNRLCFAELINLGVFLCQVKLTFCIHDVCFFNLKHALRQIIWDFQELHVDRSQLFSLGDLLHAVLGMLLFLVGIEILGADSTHNQRHSCSSVIPIWSYIFSSYSYSSFHFWEISIMNLSNTCILSWSVKSSKISLTFSAWFIAEVAEWLILSENWVWGPILGLLLKPCKESLWW